MCVINVLLHLFFVFVSLESLAPKFCILFLVSASSRCNVLCVQRLLFFMLLQYCVVFSMKSCYLWSLINLLNTCLICSFIISQYVRFWNKEIIDSLLSRGADVNKSNKFGKTPLIYAIKIGNKDIIKIFVFYMMKSAHKYNKIALIYVRITVKAASLVIDIIIIIHNEISTAEKASLCYY